MPEVRLISGSLLGAAAAAGLADYSFGKQAEVISVQTALEQLKGGFSDRETASKSLLERESFTSDEAAQVIRAAVAGPAETKWRAKEVIEQNKSPDLKRGLKSVCEDESLVASLSAEDFKFLRAQASDYLSWHAKYTGPAGQILDKVEPAAPQTRITSELQTRIANAGNASELKKAIKETTQLDEKLQGVAETISRLKEFGVASHETYLKFSCSKEAEYFLIQITNALVYLGPKGAQRATASIGEVLKYGDVLSDQGIEGARFKDLFNKCLRNEGTRLEFEAKIDLIKIQPSPLADSLMKSVRAYSEAADFSRGLRALQYIQVISELGLSREQLDDPFLNRLASSAAKLIAEGKDDITHRNALDFFTAYGQFLAWNFTSATPNFPAKQFDAYSAGYPESLSLPNQPDLQALRWYGRIVDKLHTVGLKPEDEGVQLLLARCQEAIRLNDRGAKIDLEVYSQGIVVRFGYEKGEIGAKAARDRISDRIHRDWPSPREFPRPH